MRTHFVFIACLLVPTPRAAIAEWAVLPNAPVANARHEDVFFVDPELGWVVNGAGQIWRTTDGGDSWELQLDSISFFRSVGFANPLKGWVGSLLGGALLRVTTDGGGIWTPVQNIPSPQPPGICGIWVVDSSIAYACGRYDGPGIVIRTTDGGASWTSTDLAPQATALVDVYFLDENRGFVVGGVGPTVNDRRAVVLATTDGGATWGTKYTGDRLGELCWKISFPTEGTGFVSIWRPSGTSYLLRTTDAGESWEDLLFLDNYEEEGIGFVTPSLGWIGGWGGPTYESTDGGESWQLAGFGQYINRFRFLGENVGYAVGQNVYKYTSSTTAVAAAHETSRDIALAQNRPNPFGRSTSIPYSLAHPSEVKLTVHDPLGRTIVTLLEGSRPRGAHEIVWDGRDGAGNAVASGVYWVRLECEGSAEARKLLVVR
jgi:photosystem II stability/assembly factor-like uncharacterized protein